MKRDETKCGNSISRTKTKELFEKWYGKVSKGDWIDNCNDPYLLRCEIRRLRGRTKEITDQVEKRYGKALKSAYDYSLAKDLAHYKKVSSLRRVIRTVYHHLRDTKDCNYSINYLVQELTDWERKYRP